VSGFFNLGAAPTLILPARSIGGLIATVTVHEHHIDELIITEHPVEQGAAISDHAYKRPSEVRIEAGWDGSNNLQNVYQQLLTLQANRVPFAVYTGKRMYTNMLVGSLSVETDETKENVLMVTAICRQIILVTTSTVQTPASTSPSVQTQPQATAPVQNQGSQNAAPANVAPSSFAGYTVAT
jgi:hypothetical protein